MDRRGFLALGCACCAAATLGLRAEAAPRYGKKGLPQALELGTEKMTRIAETVWVAPIAPGLWLHSTTEFIQDEFYFPANGLILERDGGSLLIDTGYRPDQAEALLAWSKRALAHPISLAVATHFHFDRTGGVPALQKHGIRTLAHPMTCDLAAAIGLPSPEPIAGFTGDVYGLDAACELFFPGAGHTRDNIVAWLPKQKVLFGGCLLKSATSADLGYLGDAIPEEWPASVRRVRDRYRDATVVVPGHGTMAGDPIGTTLTLLAT